MFSYTIIADAYDEDGNEFGFVKEVEHHCQFKVGDILMISSNEFMVTKVSWDLDHLQHAYIELESFVFSGSPDAWKNVFDSVE